MESGEKMNYNVILSLVLFVLSLLAIIFCCKKRKENIKTSIFVAAIMLHLLIVEIIDFFK